jgi:probable phosphoglycerate mutase
MRLIIIRHADPNYEKDSLTPTGFKEADLLADYLLKEKIDYVYCSPLGRAKDTIKPYLEKSGKEAPILPWLEEFHPYVKHPTTKARVAWDFLPEELTDSRLFTDEWHKAEIYKGTEVKKRYDEVVGAFDGLMRRHGYEIEGTHYKVLDSNHDTILLSCHFGVSCVLLSRLLHCSPVIFWQGAVMIPSAITRLHSEERREGIASFRMDLYGATPHLDKAGEGRSFAARFCECFSDDTRHD